MGNVFNLLITRPFAFILLNIYYFTKSYGLSIIIFSIIAKVILFPLALKTKKSTLATARLQPKMAELQKKYKTNKQKYNEEVQKLYSEEKVNPLSGCLPTLITLPIMFGLYYVITKPLTYLMNQSAASIKSIATTLSGLITDPAVKLSLANMGSGKKPIIEINIAQNLNAHIDQLKNSFTGLFKMDFSFLGMDLSKTPKTSIVDGLLLLVVISGLTAFLSSWLMQKWNPMNANMDPNTKNTTKMMMYTMPMVSVFIGFSIPAGVTVYWIMNNLLTIGQEYLTNRIVKNKMKKEEEIRASQEAKKEKKKPVIPKVKGQKELTEESKGSGANAETDGNGTDEKEKGDPSK